MLRGAACLSLVADTVCPRVQLAWQDPLYLLSSTCGSSTIVLFLTLEMPARTWKYMTTLCNTRVKDVDVLACSPVTGEFKFAEEAGAARSLPEYARNPFCGPYRGPQIVLTAMAGSS